MVSDKRILQLWRSPTFSGSYRGIRTFQLLLKTDLNIDVSQKKLYELLRNDPIFLIHQKPIRKFDRRAYDVNNYGELVQADIAYMFQYNDYKYFLIAVDCFSSKTFTVSLKSKDSKSVAKAFEEIFRQFNAPIYEIQTDRGKEFQGECKKLFAAKNILYSEKFGKNKANFAENGILILKKRLYKLLRGSLSQDWVKYLPKVVNDYNNTPIKKLGWLKPNSIQSESDSVKVAKARAENDIKVYSEPTFQAQRENQKTYENSETNLKVNDYVYLDFDEKLFDKSFDVSVRKYQCTFFYLKI
jgi:hypothetical protein